MRRAAFVVPALLVVAVVASVAPAVAQDVTQVTTPPEVGAAQGEANESAPAEAQQVEQQIGPVESDDDSTGHETADPQPPEHASGSVAEATIGDEATGTDVVVGHTNSQVEPDGRARGDAVVLAIGGTELAGVHSDSQGDQGEQITGPTAVGCEDPAAMGLACVELLFASSNSSQSGNTSHSDSHVALLFACVGAGGNTAEECSTGGGVLAAGVSTADSEIDEDRNTGFTHARHRSSVADACVGTTCADVLQAESESTTPDDTNRSSRVLGLNDEDLLDGALGDVLGGLVGEEGLLAACAEGGLLGLDLVFICANQGETHVSVQPPGTSGRQEALHVAVPNLLLLHLATAETLVFENRVAGEGPGPGPAGPAGPAVAAERAAGPRLPVTGWNLLFPLVLALGFVLSGAALVSRRR